MRSAPLEPTEKKVKPTKEPKKAGKGKLKTLEFIRNAGKPVSISDIIDGTGFNRQLVSSSHIFCLNKEGLIKSPVRGMWEIASIVKPISPNERKISEVEEFIPAYKPSKKGNGELDMDDFKEEMY